MISDAKLRSLKYKRLESEGEKNKGQLLSNRLPDRDGMYINVSPSGTITFRYDFRFPPSAKGKRQCITHGRYPLMSLEEARMAHIEALRKIRNGLNPMEERRQKRRQIVVEDEFKAVAERWYERNKAGKSKSWLRANRRFLDAAYPYIGARKIKDVGAQDISAIITPIETSGKAVTAEKMRQTYVAVFDYAAGKEFLLGSGTNPARVLSVDVPDTKHHAHLSISEVPAFLKAVDADKGPEQLKLAAKLLFLVLTRKMELCGAKWEELDLDAGRWEIPASRMKGKKPHIVPLSDQAVVIFRRLKELAGSSEWVFPGPRGKQHISGDKVLRLFYRIGYAGKATPHGCRSTASTALNEMGYNADHIERQLAHVEEDEVRASYNHAEFMIQRRKMLQDWADAIDRICAGLPLRSEDENVFQLKPKAA